MKHIIRRIIPIMLLFGGTLTGCNNPANNETHYVRLSDAACTFRHTDNTPFTIEVITSPDNWEARSSGSWLQAERQGTALVLTPEENLRLVSAKADMKILEELGLSREESKRNIMHLSGGQRQRVAVGRALVAPGRAILADEPTGSLDPEMTDEVIHLLQHAAHQLGKCVIVVTHSKRVANSADVVLRLRSKKLTRA